MRETAVAEVLHRIEDATVEERGISVGELVELTSLSETTVRKAIKELKTGGFIDVGAFNGHPTTRGSARWIALSKHEEQGEEVNVADTKEETRPRGRPRSPEAQARDDEALKVITKAKDAGATREDVADALSITPQLAYLSIWRLAKAGKVAKFRDSTRTPRYRAAG